MCPRAVFALGLLIGLTGCANPGPPRPPTLDLPRVVTDLDAERIGASVHLSWTTPARTTDGLLIPGSKASGPFPRKARARSGVLAAEICRQDDAISPACTPIARTTVLPGEASAFSDALPPALQHGLPRLLRYQVRILNAVGKDAGASLPASTLAGEAPPALTAFVAHPARRGAGLRWNSTSAADEVRILRTTDGTANKPVTMRVPPGTDHGGTVDTGAQPGTIYHYRASRIRTATFAGKQLQMSSDPAFAATGAAGDSLPPTVPEGLVAASNSATGDGKAAIDLSWEPVMEPRLAGYLVYRSSAGAPPVRLTLKPLPVTAFHDETISPGITYAYRVSAVDIDGTESPQSNPVMESAR